MNKMKYIIQILIAVTLFGCTDEEIFKSKGDIEVIAGFANTRTTFVEDDGVTHVIWNEGDAIGLFTENQNNLQYVALHNGSETKFSAIEEQIAAKEGDEVFAYYPFSGDTENAQKVGLPNLTVQSNNKIFPNSDFIYASGKVDNKILSLQFKHLFTFLKITIPLESLWNKEGKYSDFYIESSEHIVYQSNSAFFDLTKKEIVTDSFSNKIYYSVPSTEELKDKQEITCYIAMLPQTENAEIKMYFWDSGKREYLLIKKVPSGGFKAGNVYTLYLNESETIKRKERDALIAFYNATDGDNWINNENWCSDKPVSQWYGVIANEGLVQVIRLDDNNLKGKITVSELANLSQLEALLVSNNKLTEIDLSYTPKIRSITCDNNWLTTLDISKNDSLDWLVCYKNQIAVLDVSNKPKLRVLHCDNNQIEKLDINNSPKLETLNCHSNKLKLLNFSNSPKLEYLECGVNSISTIEVSNLLSLKHLGCAGNQLTELDVHNNSQLEDLSCSGNQIKSLDVSNCLNLINLHCGNNQLSTIDISKNAELVSLGCNNNQITNIDISNNTKLSTFFCHFNELSSLDVSHNVELETLWCHQNQLSSLDVTMLPKLKGLDCGNWEVKIDNQNSGNHLTNIDVSKNPLLEELACFGMKLTTLDVSNNLNLTMLECSVNPIMFLDVSKNRALAQLYTRYMNLSTLDVSNNLKLEDLATLHNPNLSYIYIAPEQNFSYEIDQTTQLVYKDENDFYESTDYTQDGVSTTLQQATQGNGIDIVFMGDGYSDRLIADGTYNNTMRLAMDKFFSEEPYKSFRSCFNVYSVTAVSKNEGINIGKETVFSSYLGGGTLVGGNDARVLEYAQKVLPINRMDEALIIVMMNSTQYAGTCYMYYPSSGDYSNGTSIAYFPIGTDETAFEQVLHHEAGGHGFAKLDDEYTIVQEINTPTEDFINERQRLALNGWWKNIDFTYNPMTVKWSKFLNDSRYAYDGLNVFEGASTFEKGVYRPTENSIMRYNTGGFNAPSREAIYYRIHKLAYGESWQYDYEQFVTYDAINRKTNASTRIPYRITDNNTIPLHAPVVIKAPWYKAKNNAPKQQRILPRNIHRSPQKITKVTMMDDAHESYIQKREIHNNKK